MRAWLLAAGCALLSCGPLPPESKPLPPECDAYAAWLQSCTEVSKTLRESIDCENWWRRHCGRPPRPPAVGLERAQKKDGGR